MKRETAEALKAEALDGIRDGVTVAWLQDRLVPALDAELAAVRTPLEDLYWCRDQLRRLAESIEPSDGTLLDVIREYRQVLRQINDMEQKAGTKAGAAGAGGGKLDALLSGGS